MTGADALIDFDRRLNARYIGNRTFELWLTGTEIDCNRVQMPGSLLKQLLDDRYTVVSEPLKLARDGREVVIYLQGEEIGRLNAETVRNLIQRAVRVR